MDGIYDVVSKETGLIWSRYANEIPNIEVVQFEGKKLVELEIQKNPLSPHLYEVYETPDGEYVVFHSFTEDADRSVARFLEVGGSERLTLRDLQENYPEIAVELGLPRTRSLL